LTLISINAPFAELDLFLFALPRCHRDEQQMNIADAVPGQARRAPVDRDKADVSPTIDEVPTPAA
jgi:hypothetical protein